MEDFGEDEYSTTEEPGGLGLEAEDVFYALEELPIPNEDKWCLMRDLSNDFVFGFNPDELYELIAQTFYSFGFGSEEISSFLENLQFPNSGQSSIDEIRSFIN
ncbi:MAG: hypothetical protein ACOX0R_03620 [Candidatus Dojkabacteria bacterium]|jgi:hypothetical protein